LAAGIVTDGLQRLEILLRPIYEAIKERNPNGDWHLAEETRWRVFVVQEGKQGYGWWLWVLSGPDTVVYGGFAMSALVFGFRSWRFPRSFCTFRVILMDAGVW